MGSQHFLLFGDQTVDLIPSLQRLLRLSQSSPTTRGFLQSALDVIQRKTSALSADERNKIGHFDSFDAILQKYLHTEDTIGVTHTVVICVCRLAELILYDTLRIPFSERLICTVADSHNQTRGK
jgi:hypothetical protein